MIPWALMQNQLWNRLDELREYLLLDDIGDIFIVDIVDDVSIYSGNLLGLGLNEYHVPLDIDFTADEHFFDSESRHLVITNFFKKAIHRAIPQLKFDEILFKPFLTSQNSYVVFCCRKRFFSNEFHYMIAKELVKQLSCSTDLSNMDPTIIIYRTLNELVNDIPGSAHLFELVCLLSSELYEGEISSGKIQIVKKGVSINEALLLDTAIPFDFINLRRIRKLFQMSKENSMLLQYELVQNSVDPVISVIGIGKYESRFSIIITGHLQWSFQDIGAEIFQYKKGRYIAPYNSNEAKEKFLDTSVASLKISMIEAKKLNDIVEVARKENHGTSLLFCSDASKEANRLCKANRGFLCAKPFFLYDSQISYILAMTAIDGALIIDSAGYCHCFGTILDGETIIRGSSARGARYNSVQNYVALMKEKNNLSSCVAVVISEDKSIDIFSTNDEFDYIR